MNTQNGIAVNFDPTNFKAFASEVIKALSEVLKGAEKPAVLRIAAVDAQPLQRGLETHCGHDFYLPPGYDLSLPKQLNFDGEGGRFYGMDIERDETLRSGQAVVFGRPLDSVE